MRAEVSSSRVMQKPPVAVIQPKAGPGPGLLLEDLDLTENYSN